MSDRDMTIHQRLITRLSDPTTKLLFDTVERFLVEHAGVPLESIPERNRQFIEGNRTKIAQMILNNVNLAILTWAKDNGVAT